MKKFIILIVSFFIVLISFNCTSCLPTYSANNESEEVTELKRQLDEKDKEIEELKNDEENIDQEEVSQESKTSDYNNRLAEFNSLLNQINDMYNKHFLTVIYPLVESTGDKPEEIISNAEQIIAEFESWQDELSVISPPGFVLNMVNYFIDWTVAGIEFFTYSKENPVNYNIVKMDQLKENLTSSLKKATGESTRIELNFNNEAEELGLEIPFPNAELSSEEVEEEALVKPEEEAVAAEEIFAIGDVVRMGDLVFTVNSARWEEGDEWFKPEEGERWLLLDCTIENESNKSTSISSLLMFKLYDEDSYSRDMELFADTKGSLDGEVGVGRKMRGEIAFSVEEGQSYWEFIFKPELFGFGQAIFAINEDEVQ